MRLVRSTRIGRVLETRAISEKGQRRLPSDGSGAADGGTVLYQPCPLSWRVILSTVFDGFLTPGTELGGSAAITGAEDGGQLFEYQMSGRGGRLQVLRSHWEFSVLALEAKTKQDQNQNQSYLLHVPSDPSRALALALALLLPALTKLNSPAALVHPSASIKSLARG
jgi:hypothetical protein